MRYSLALLALAAAIQASPIALPQGVTAKISPSAPAPPGCSPTYTAGTFGIAVMNISTKAAAKRQVSTISDGQPQAATSTAVVSTISDGQPQAPTSAAPVSTISDGQPQAPKTTAAPVSTISDGQPQAPKSTPMMHTVAHVSQIHDGQIQGGMHTVTMMPVSQITDGQIQGGKKTVTMMAVTTIVDGQPQAPTMPVVSTISDGQPQAPKSTKSAVSTISDGQPQAPTSTASVASEKTDGQPVATTSSGSASATATGMSMQMVGCKSNSSLEISLAGGVLTDSIGRTGYIAANYQFQFDKPPQAGALFTAGFSICANGSLALGGSNVFYQCLSGNFYNLYNTDWAAQCSPVTIETLMLVDCA